MTQSSRGETQQDELREFLSASTLETIIPEEDSVQLDWISSLSAELPDVQRQDDSAPSSSIAPTLNQRKLLFIDEILPVYIILRAPFVEEETLKSYLSELEITLETHAVGIAPAKAEGPNHEENDQSVAPTHPPVKDLVATAIIDDSEEPIVAVEGENEDKSKVIDAQQKAASRCVFIIWRTQTHINHAQIHSSNPHIYFNASIQLKSRNPSSQTHGNEYLISGVPGSMNLLESFKNDPILADHPPMLTTVRLSKVIPAGIHGDGAAKPLRSSSRCLTRLVPALSSKIRFFGLGASPSQAKVLASLDVDISPFTTGKTRLESIGLKLSDGRIDCITSDREIPLPITCSPLDGLSFVYNLVPDQSRYSVASKTGTHNLSLELCATVLQPGVSTVAIKSAWKTNVNLSGFARRPALLPPSSTSFSSTTIHEYLLTLTISGPSKIFVGEHLRWSLLFANRSAHRTLSLAVIPITFSSQAQASATPVSLDRSGSDCTHKHKPTLSTSLFQLNPFAKSDSAAPAPKMTPAPDLIPLTADLRIGPLVPGASATAEIRFLVLRAGLLSVEAIRIVDLDGEAEGLVVEEKQRSSTADSQPANVSSYPKEKAIHQEGDNRRGKLVFVDVKTPLLPDVVAVESSKASIERSEEDFLKA